MSLHQPSTGIALCQADKFSLIETKSVYCLFTLSHTADTMLHLRAPTTTLQALTSTAALLALALDFAQAVY